MISASDCWRGCRWERRLALDGVSTALLEGGGGPPVVFLQAEFAAVWMRVIPELVRTHRVIAPDLPGLGASQVSHGPPTIDTVMTWVGELIEQTCSTPPVLVGKGAAGAIAARFAVDHSDRLQALVLVDSYGLARYRPPVGMVLTYAGTGGPAALVLRRLPEDEREALKAKLGAAFAPSPPPWATSSPVSRSARWRTEPARRCPTGGAC